MDIERVKFTETEAEKVFAVMDEFKESFCGFAKAVNLSPIDANLLVQGAMMAFTTFSCVNRFSTIILCKIIMDKLYGEQK